MAESEKLQEAAADRTGAAVVDQGRPGGELSRQLWDVEFALTVTDNAFQRWIVRCMAAAGCEGLSATDVMVLHAINRRAPSRNVSDITLLLGIEDSRPVSYAIKKLESKGLVQSRRRGKEKIFSTTAEGAALCERYITVREKFLVDRLDLSSRDREALEQAFRILMKVSSAYDHAARAVIT